MQNQTETLGNEVNQPLFQKLLEGVRQEVANSMDLTGVMVNLINKISENKNPIKIEEVDKLAKTNECGIIDLLWEEVWLLRSSNKEMERTCKHLQSIVGM